jgi:hypothetical protein
MFNNIIYGDYGAEKATAASAIGGLPLGTLMILPDGRKFRHAQASATALAAGKLYQGNSMADIAGTADGNIIAGLAVAASAAIGATSVSVTMAATAHVSKDLLADGYLLVATSAGQGHVYKIKGNTAAGSLGTTTVTLEPTDPLKVALAASSTKVGLRANAFKSVTVTTADTVGVGAIVGVAPVAVAASYYCWVQRSGEAAVLADATLIEGIPVTASSAVAGAVMPAIATTTTHYKQRQTVGFAIAVSASASYSAVYLTLE